MTDESGGSGNGCGGTAGLGSWRRKDAGGGAENRGNTLRLRPMKPSDLDCLSLWLKDERTVELWRADRFTWPLTGEQLDRYWSDFLSDPGAFALMAVDGSGAPAGHFSFREIDYGKNSAHMGFIVLDPEARGRGYGREMAALALTYAFSILGMRRVTLGVFDCNQAARKCYEAVGFREIDRPHRMVDFHGERWEYFYMAAEPGR